MCPGSRFGFIRPFAVVNLLVEIVVRHFVSYTYLMFSCEKAKIFKCVRTVHSLLFKLGFVHKYLH